MGSIDDARRTAAAGLAVEDRRLELAGVRTAVLEGGAGPPVVLLHGPVANAFHWRRVIPALTERHHVVAPDLPGQGATPPTAAGSRGEVLAWLDALVDGTCEGPPVMVGLTLGGAIAASYAAEHPGRLESLVLVSRAIVAAASGRDESRGAHFRSDFPETRPSEDLAFTKVTLTGGELRLDWEGVRFTRVNPGKTLLAA